MWLDLKTIAASWMIALWSSSAHAGIAPEGISTEIDRVSDMSQVLLWDSFDWDIAKVERNVEVVPDKFSHELLNHFRMWGALFQIDNLETISKIVYDTGITPQDIESYQKNGITSLYISYAKISDGKLKWRDGRTVLVNVWDDFEKFIFTTPMWFQVIWIIDPRKESKN